MNAPRVSINENKQIISRYGNGSFIINDHEFYCPVFINGNQIFSFSEAKLDDLINNQIRFITSKIDISIEGTVMLVGKGEASIVLPKQSYEKLKGIGVALEVMDTGAACRTFNVLQGDGREVCVLLMPVP